MHNTIVNRLHKRKSQKKIDAGSPEGINEVDRETFIRSLLIT
jgi:hypothetical protein